jgi:hypothetical protein
MSHIQNIKIYKIHEAWATAHGYRKKTTSNKRQAPSTKHQAPSVKRQAPSAHTIKLQKFFEYQSK